MFAFIIRLKMIAIKDFLGKFRFSFYLHNLEYMENYMKLLQNKISNNFIKLMSAISQHCNKNQLFFIYKSTVLSI
ncbi:hypothetical protein MCSV2_20103 [Mucispirillum schaedleri ASF457]|nr:hypothetical protein MCSV2_20103 [Mucispirillum schaedleri ASF457]